MQEINNGKVAVGQDASPAAQPKAATLNAGDVITISNDQVQLHHNANVTTLLAWTSGCLIFTTTPLRDAIPDLNRWYDVDIRLADPALGTRALTGPMLAASPAELAYTLGRVLDVRIERNGRVITVYPRP